MASKRMQRGLKRVVDLIGASAVLVATAPVLAGATVGILATMGRPVLFVQERPGRGEHPFRMFKLRTMRAPKAGEDWIHSALDRVSPFGRFLRRTSIDELPELWNVLRGEMSLVGPRPWLPSYTTRLSAEQRRRFDVRPGMTGLAAIHGRQDAPFSERISLDLRYLDEWSLWLDVKILCVTVLQVASGKGSIGERPVQDIDDLGLTHSP